MHPYDSTTGPYPMQARGESRFSRLRIITVPRGVSSDMDVMSRAPEGPRGPAAKRSKTHPLAALAACGSPRGAWGESSTGALASAGPVHSPGALAWCTRQGAYSQGCCTSAGQGGRAARPSRPPAGPRRQERAGERVGSRPTRWAVTGPAAAICLVFQRFPHGKAVDISKGKHIDWSVESRRPG